MAGASTSPQHQTWSSRLTFVLATIGFSVGLGNIWRFPYLAGENGGGAFVLIYIACVFLIGIPVVMTELAIGRRGRLTPAASLGKIAREEGKSGLWSIAGGFMMLTAFLIVTYYCVIGGWTLHYVYLAVTGAFDGVDPETSQSLFDDLLANPFLLAFWQAIFILLNASIVARGLKNGIERAVVFLMPALFLILIGLAVYGLAVGDAARGLSFLFQPDFSKVTPKTYLDAMGQAFFSVGVGMAVMITYGAYLPKSINIPKTATIISLADTGVALISGLAVFPFVFAFGVSPTEGPGLVFVALPAALAKLGGGVAMIAFFILLTFAAITSSIATFEVVASWGEERGWPRVKTVFGSALICWVLGLATVLSFNAASNFHPLAALSGFDTATMFDILDNFTSTVGLPVGGLLAAIFAGWVISKKTMSEELGGAPSGLVFRFWRFIIRWPIILVIVALIVAGVLP